MRQSLSHQMENEMAHYEWRVDEGRAISLSSGLSSHDCYTGKVIRIETGEAAWSSKTYWDKAPARLQASKMLKRFERYIERNGVGWEEEQAAIRAEFKGRKDAALKARKETKDRAGDLLAALQEVAPDHPLAQSLTFPEVPTE